MVVLHQPQGQDGGCGQIGDCRCGLVEMFLGVGAGGGAPVWFAGAGSDVGSSTLGLV